MAFRTLSRDRYLTDAELGRLLAAARLYADEHGAPAARRAFRDRLALALLVSTGIRPGELIRLRRRDLVMRGATPWVRVRRLKKRARRGVIDDLPVSLSLARLLRRYCDAQRLEGETLLFPVSVRTLERVYHAAARRAGIEGRSLYALRHTALSRLYQATKDLRLVQEMAGHERADTTSIYTHLSDAEMVSAVAKVRLPI